MDETKAKLIECFHIVFPDVPKQQLPSATMDSIAAWESLTGVALATVVEEEFGIEIDPDDMMELTSFEGILHYLESRRSTS